MWPVAVPASPWDVTGGSNQQSASCDQARKVRMGELSSSIITERSRAEQRRAAQGCAQSKGPRSRRCGEGVDR